MRRTSILVVLSALILGLPPALFGQEPGSIGRVFRVQPLPGHQAQFEEAYKGHVEWHREQEDEWNWDCWEYIAGPYTGQYAVVTGGHHWADFSRPEIGKADQEHARKHLSPHIESIYGYFSRIHPELSSMAALDRPPALASLYVYTLKPGMGGQFVEAVRQIHETLQAAEWEEPYFWVEVAEGSSEGDQFYVVVPRESWGDFEEPEKTLAEVVREQLDESEANALRQRFWETVKSYESHTVAYRTDLSYRPR